MRERARYLHGAAAHCYDYRVSQYVHQIGEEESARIRRFLIWLAAGMVLFVLLVGALVVTADNWLRLVSPSAERRFIEPYIE